MIWYVFDETTLVYSMSVAVHDGAPAPKNAVSFAPPRLEGPQAARINATRDAWDVVEDYRSSYVADARGQRVIITDVGPLPDGLHCVPWEEVHAQQAEEAAQRQAVSESESILSTRMQRSFVQTEPFTAAEFATFAKAGLFDAWTVGTIYARGNRIEHEGVAYEVQQPVTAQAHQPPGSAGMLAIYRPISTGGADGSRENPYSFINGMDVDTGKYYTYEGALYLAKADMKPCTWPPGTAGLWQWELVA